MASYTDKAPTFNPYVAQKPVDVMAKVGMQKQAQYQQGYEKIQDSIDNIAGLDIVRPQDKAHLQTKLNELGTKLQGVAAADFSNFQLSNSVAGMASSLIQDDGISGAVGATQRYKKEQSRVDADKKAGKLTPDNLLHYQKQVNAYFQDEEVGASFNGEYKPHFDVLKHVRETFDDLKPDGYTLEQVYELDANGEPTRDKNGQFTYAPAMMRTVKKGMFPPKVKEALDQIFSDPRVSQQLQITGQYNYQGSTSEDLQFKIGEQKKAEITSVNKSIDDLIIDKNLEDTDEGKEAVQLEIDKLNSYKTMAISSFDSAIQAAQDNPDGVRGMLYTAETKSRYTTMFTNIDSQTTAESNPYWDAHFKTVQERNTQSRFTQRLKFDISKKEQDQLNWQKDYDQNQAVIDAKALEDGGGKPKPTPDFVKPFDVVNNQTNRYIKATTNVNNAQNELIWENLVSDTPGNKKKLIGLKTRMNREEGITLLIREHAVLKDPLTPEQALLPKIQQELLIDKKVEKFVADKMKKIVTSINSKNSTNTALDRELYSSYLSKNRIYESEQAITDMRDELMKEEYGDLTDKALLSDITDQIINIDGEEIRLSRQDIIDMATIRRGNGLKLFNFAKDRRVKKAANSARARLRLQGKEGLYDKIENDRNLYNRARSVGSRLEGGGVEQYNFIREMENGGSSPQNWSQIDKAFGIVDTQESLDMLEREAEIINSAYNMRGPQQISLLSGKTEFNEARVNDLGDLASKYLANEQNMSGDFKEFAANINKTLDSKVNYKVNAGAGVGVNGEAVVEIRLFDGENKRIGGMTILPEEAESLNLDIDELWDTDEVRAIRTIMNTREGSTSKENPSSRTTYENSDSYFNRNDFHKLGGLPVDVQINYRKANNKYFSYSYIKDEFGNQFIYSSPEGVKSLGKLVEASKSVITPEFITTFLNKQYAKAEAK